MMIKEPKLKTKLEFNFNIDDLELPDMDFLVEEPIEEIKVDIRILEKQRPKGVKTTKKLF